jgi:hypothetical protein
VGTFWARLGAKQGNPSESQPMLFRRSGWVQRSDQDRFNSSILTGGSTFCAGKVAIRRPSGPFWAHFSSNACATESRSVSNRSVYTSNVMAALRWPSWRCTTNTLKTGAANPSTTHLIDRAEADKLNHEIDAATKRLKSYAVSKLGVTAYEEHGHPLNKLNQLSLESPELALSSPVAPPRRAANRARLRRTCECRAVGQAHHRLPPKPRDSLSQLIVE